MEKLKYKIIKNKIQYKEYCHSLEALLASHSKNIQRKDEIELLTLLIGKWDNEHSSFNELDPIELLCALMDEHAMKAKDVVDLLGVSKGLVSDIMNYKKGMSKGVIKILADHFKVAQEAFNRPYPLKLSQTYRPVKQHKMMAAEPKARYARQAQRRTK